MRKRPLALAAAAVLAGTSLVLPSALAETSGSHGSHGSYGKPPAQAPAQSEPIPHRYRVTGPDTREERTTIAGTGVSIDEVKDRAVVITGQPAQAELIRKMGYRVEELAQKLGYPPEDALYHDYREIVAELDTIVRDHPQIAKRVTVGKTHEGRDIPAIKISDNVAADEDEPEVLFTANQHAREHLTPEMALYAANLFTDGHGSDNRITELVDGREIWIIASVNPDGLEYDIATGRYRMWRHNRQPVQGAIGIDLNRNWAYKWGCCGGSSGTPGAETYRGPAPEAGVETKTVANFVRGRVVGGKQQIKAHIDFHTYSELVLWPMGHTYDDTGPDMSADAYRTFATIGREMAATNRYTPQQSSDLYITDGSVNDWMWAEQDIFSYTFEMYPRNADFYPPDEVIVRETTRNRAAVLALTGYADCPYRAIGKQDQYC
ncbi:M14 family metallopeptidase [Spirillospora sp. NBC_00431]